jgi:transcriptional regulator with XRE-family HTH domain
MITTVGGRVRLLRKSLGLTSVELSKRTGINRTYISDVESNRREPSRNFLDSLNATFNASYDWLLTGQGEMFLAKEDETASREGNPLKDASVKLLDDMSDEQIQKAYDYLRDQKQLGEFLRKKGA